MTKAKVELPPAEEIEKRYHHCYANVGFQTARDRTLPNAGIGTDEREVLAIVQDDDEDNFIGNLAKRIRETTPGF